MPDIMAIGVGGGSLVSADGTSVGPKSVGHRLVTQGLVFGGNQVTATDIVVAAGLHSIGDTQKVAHLKPEMIKAAHDEMHRLIDDAIDRMRPCDDPVPVILVGGGSILISQKLNSASKIVCPEHADVANAIGAAIAQVGGQVESIISYRKIKREDAIAKITQEAKAKAVLAGADGDSLRVLDVEETPMSYMDDNAVRLRIKVVGELKKLVKS